MMSDSSDAFDPSKRGAPDEPDQPDPATGDLEGSSTQVDGEAPHERTVAGEPASEQHGTFIRTDPPKPHPGPYRG